jgi:hypothetical protein
VGRNAVAICLQTTHKDSTAHSYPAGFINLLCFCVLGARKIHYLYPTTKNHIVKTIKHYVLELNRYRWSSCGFIFCNPRTLLMTIAGLQANATKIMKKYLFLLIVNVFIGCSSVDSLKTVKYFPWEKGTKYFIDIPYGQKLEIIHELDQTTAYIFKYKDGSTITIGGGEYPPNKDHIKELGDSIYQFRFQNNDLYLELNQIAGKELLKTWPDTLILSGLDKNGLYWKSILLSKKHIGLDYINVPKEKKELFDKALYSFRVERRKK